MTDLLNGETGRHGHTMANSPFGRGDGDIILLTSDLVRFSVHKIILSLSSPVFSDMLTLGENSGHPDDLISESGIPMVPVTETSDSLDIFLRLIYPTCRPPVVGFGEIPSIMEVGRKYQATGVIKFATKALQAHIDEDPLTVFGVACRMNLEVIARAAAEHVVRLPAHTFSTFYYVPEMDQISAGSFFRLLWHIRRPNAATTKEYWKNFSFVTRNPSDGTTSAFNLGASHRWKCGEALISSWCTEANPFERHPPDLTVRCSDGVDAPAHCLVLSLASPVLSDLIAASSHELPAVIHVTEPSRLVYYLLLACYGHTYPWVHASPSISDVDKFSCFFQAMHVFTQYGLRSALQQSRVLFQSLLKANPLRSYFVAYALGWKAEARVAATLAVSDPKIDISTAYVAEMESVSAKAYLNLLKYDRDVAASRNTIFNTYNNARQLPDHLYPDTARNLIKGFYTYPSLKFREDEKVCIAVAQREIEKETGNLGLTLNLIKESRNMEAALQTALSQCVLELD
ncbi:hypothetical protein BXZ70DRAFT_905517 [Cristinia sonorae]|uniref:BTB domain-containing protein n=1 Tax=Cristinia sonorae TaxID=1940300 RepID=A0A8K0UUB7_9AGAR|nr:hypothetical protein BXZ70DRAFT_905517 [Cristinia sonorae]